MNNSNIIMYTTEDGLTKIETTFEDDTVWLSLDQMAELFQRDRSVIGKHCSNVINRPYPATSKRFMKRANYSVIQLLQILQQFKWKVSGK